MTSDLMTAFFPALTALALTMARPMGVAMILPVFTRAQVGAPIRAAFAFVLAIPAWPAIYRALQDTPKPTPILALLSAKEMMIGIVIGLIAGLPIWGVQSIGEFFDTHRSATQGQNSEPGTNNQDSLSATLLGMTAIGLFVTGGGLTLVAEAVAESEALLPPLTLAFRPAHGAASALLGLADQIERVSLMTAAPVTLAMILCDACVILLMRAIPKLHLYDLAPTLRNLAFVLMMLAYAAWLVNYARQDMTAGRHIMAGVRTLLAP